MLACELLDVDDDRWPTALEDCRHDLYHLPGYAGLEGNWISARPAAFLARGQEGCLLIPLLLREIPDRELLDAVTPYGYSPPVVSEGVSAAFVHEALHAYDELAREHRIISTFMRLHPMLCPEVNMPDTLEHWTQLQRGQTVDMPLEEDEETWERGLVKGHRYDLRRLRRAGGSLEIDSDEAWSAFPAIYRDTMERIGTAPAYFYSDDYLQAFRRTLRDHAVCAVVRNDDGDIMCASIFTRIGGLVQYHLSGTVAEFARQAPTKLLLAGMREWCREHGIKACHLGGGFGSGADTLFAFKRRFGGQVLPFRSISAVHDVPAFQRECAEWQQRSNTELPGPEGFFPPYRAPTGTD